MAGRDLIQQGVKRRKAILRFVRSYVKKKGRPPTLAEIGVKVGLASQNATRNHLLILESQGYITIEPVIGRGIQLVDPAPDGWTA